MVHRVELNLRCCFEQHSTDVGDQFLAGGVLIDDVDMVTQLDNDVRESVHFVIEALGVINLEAFVESQYGFMDESPFTITSEAVAVRTLGHTTEAHAVGETVDQCLGIFRLYFRRDADRGTSVLIAVGQSGPTLERNDHVVHGGLSESLALKELVEQGLVGAAHTRRRDDLEIDHTSVVGVFDDFTELVEVVLIEVEVVADLMAFSAGLEQMRQVVELRGDHRTYGTEELHGERVELFHRRRSCWFRQGALLLQLVEFFDFGQLGVLLDVGVVFLRVLIVPLTTPFEVGVVVFSFPMTEFVQTRAVGESNIEILYPVVVIVLFDFYHHRLAQFCRPIMGVKYLLFERKL